MISQSCKATELACPLAIAIPIQYQTFLPLPSSFGDKSFLLSSLSNFNKLGPSFHNKVKGVLSLLKKLHAFIAWSLFARSKPTIIKINNTVFTHGGVSKKFIKNRGVDFDEINDLMRNNIDFSPKKMKSRDYYKLYNSEESLVWYRDYFKEYGDDLSEKDISEILKNLNSKHIVVGHCPYDEIIPLYNNRIFGVDSSIQKGIYGEVLFIENDQFSRGKLNGKLIRIESDAQ